MNFIHDPEFEADYLENDYQEDCEMCLGERLSILAEQYLMYKAKHAEEYKHNEMRAFVRDMRDFLEDCEDEEFYRCEIIFMIYKLLITPVGHLFLKNHKLMAMTAKIEAVEFLGEIYDKPSINFMWRNTKNAIEEFMIETEHLY